MVSPRTEPSEDPDERHLIERLLQYNEDAWLELVSRERDRIYNLALRITRNPDEAEEVLQDTLLTIFNKIQTFRSESRLSTWIHAIASNAALSRLRKKHTTDVTFDEEISLNTDKALFRNGAYLFQPPTGRDALIEAELSRLLEQAIDELPDGYREIYIMKELENLPVKTIAEICDIRPGAVKTRLHRARLMLRLKLSDYWDGTA
ncbi:MAG: sigma-70 family RNA polymerase sigma factor [Leptospiraceae bacterium]|nr:sigma-70 family RNA polymerase sigma factor [Leptospiraceae bacterium]